MIKEHLYLHIGTNKTGSTTIQYCLKENQTLLKSQGYYYPMEGAYFYPPEASPSLLAHALLGNRPTYMANPNIDREACVSEIIRDIKQSDCEKVIISSEHFHSAKTVDDVKEIASVFLGLFKKITVIVYLRRQDTRLESSWSQGVKTGIISKSFEDFLSKHSGWNYFEMLNLWAEVFGKNNLVVRPFEKEQFFKNDLLQDFLKTIDCTAEISDSRLRNQSPPVEFLEVLRIFWKTIPGHLERRPLLRVLRSLPIKIDTTNYTLFTPESRKMFLDLNRESNRLVAQEYLGRSNGLLFHESETTDLPTYQGMSLVRFSEISRQYIMLLAGINTQLTNKVRNQL